MKHANCGGTIEDKGEVYKCSACGKEGKYVKYDLQGTVELSDE